MTRLELARELDAMGLEPVQAYALSRGLDLGGTVESIMSVARRLSAEAEASGAGNGSRRRGQA